ncbi:predicted protein [Naegleria gruberi]|uniref:Predicted protein n=1 Tax=Naegleria gruberi TaxID=5762 RepID=D2VVP9_NAEGR|nr:uncharacterized protein NAEGRDRAFT_81406 [Naegleria gruberi]EFC39080.1 predicted protein [Naegleria gruberi]|eukprot:XP_002671824.1 predicted protein [Naegleria gruberi strain NEG-M]
MNHKLVGQGSLSSNRFSSSPSNHNHLNKLFLLLVTIFTIFFINFSTSTFIPPINEILSDQKEFNSLTGSPSSSPPGASNVVILQSPGVYNYSVYDDLDFSFHLPACPDSLYRNKNTNQLELIVQSPSTFSLFIVIAFSSLLFASIVFSSFNSVFLPHIRKRIRTSSISNNLWIVYFVFVGLRAVLNAVHFGKPTSLRKDSKFLYAMTIVGMILHSLTAYFLTLALNYQRKHRSGFSVEATGNSRLSSFHQQIYEDREEEKLQSTFQRRTAWIRKIVVKGFWVIFSFESLATICFTFSLIAIFLRALNANSAQSGELYRWIQLGAMLFQRIPIIIICFLIIMSGFFSIFKKKSSQDHRTGGPTIFTRILIFVALLLNIPNDLPLSYWNYFLYGLREDRIVPGCMFYFASIFDAVLLLFFFSLVLWLFVMIIEFRRYRKETVEAALSDTVENFE